MTRNQLRSQFRTEIGRSNFPTSRIDFFMARVTEEISRQYRFHFLERKQTLTLATNATSVTLPNGYLQFRDVFRLSLATNPTAPMTFPKMRKVTWEEGRMRWGNMTGIPEEYLVYNNRFYIFPRPKANFRIERQFNVLVTLPATGSGTNAYFDQAAAVVLYGALQKVPKSVTNQEDLAFWQQQYEQSLANLIKDHAMEHTFDFNDAIKVGPYRTHYRWSTGAKFRR